MPSLLPTLVLVLAVTAGGDPAVRTPVFRGAMALSGRAIALFEVQGNAGTWQGEVGRMLPGSTWKIEAIDLSTGRVSIKVGARAPVTLGPGDTWQNDRVVKAPEPARAPAPLPKATRDGTGGDLMSLIGPSRPGGVTIGSGVSTGNAQLESELKRQLADPRVRKQLESLGLPLPQLFGPPTAPGGPRGAASVFRPTAGRPLPQPASAPPPSSLGPQASSLSSVPLVRALDATTTVPQMSSLGKPGYQTVVMLTSSADAACRALKPRVLALTKRPRTAVVFLEAGAGDAPIKQAWNVPSLPHFLLIDQGGGVLGSGESARRVIDSWLATK